MFKFILRKTEFKQYDKKTQDQIIPFWIEKFVISRICCILFHFIFFIAPMILLLISVHGEKEIDLVLTIGVIIHSILWSLFYIYFGEEIISFSTYGIGCKVYHQLYTLRGKALTKKDFEKIKSMDSKFYEHITSMDCKGKCYDVSFKLLRMLRTGNIKFMAVTNCNSDESEQYTLHAVYEKDGWVFDTYNQHQYPVEKAIALHKAIVYKTFSYKDFEHVSNNKFVNMYYEDIAQWCKEHDCSQTFKEY